MGIAVFYILFYKKKEKSDNLKIENSEESKDVKEENKFEVENKDV